MEPSRPTMKTVTRDEAQAQFDQLLTQVAEGKTRTRIEENGKPLAGLVSADELEFLARFGRAPRALPAAPRELGGV